MSLIKRGRLSLLLFAVAFAGTMAMGQIAIVNNGTPAHMACSTVGSSCTTTGVDTTGATIEFAGCYSNYGVCTVTSSPFNFWFLVGGACYSPSSSFFACLYEAYGPPPATSASQTATFTGSSVHGFFQAYTGKPFDGTSFDVISGASN